MEITKCFISSLLLKLDVDKMQEKKYQKIKMNKIL